MEQVYVLREQPNGNNLIQVEELSLKLLIQFMIMRFKLSHLQNVWKRFYYSLNVGMI